ncbi:MAG TPA: endonuclease/exonuclease/phosphatase family protein [Chthoniobacterales bacterium]|nr:endonuclease/exonuclease/phosphatase family protein [Chthoniobacterales bacterium]
MRYKLLKYRIPADRQKLVAENLIKLSQRLDKTIPSKDAEHNLLLATWNIRDFGKRYNRGFGPRLPESLFYIAEMLSRFDFVAVQEVNELYDFEKVLEILGNNWDFIATDVTDPKIGGNGERLTYLFDKRKVQFQNIAGEIVLPTDMLISKARVAAEGETKLFAGRQFRRTPFTAKFQAGWFRFEICTVHLYFGEESGAKLAERIEEIGQVADYFGRRSEEAEKEFRSLILLGDFNIVHPQHKTMKALTDRGFKVPAGLSGSNVKGDKYYDQIAFKARSGVLEYVDAAAESKKGSGVLDTFVELFTNEQFDQYKAEVAKSTNGKKKTGATLKKYYTNEWRTYQLSDHRPMWVRLRTNDSPKYLQAIVSGERTW